MSRNILVVGGAGYIGSHMVRALLDNGDNPFIFDNLSTGHRELVPSGVDLIEGDLQSGADISRALSSRPIDACMFFAASAVVPESVSNPLKYYRNNVLGAISLAGQMIDRGINKLIFSSTAAVYGEPHAVPITEEHPKNPTNPYGRTKWMIEEALTDLCAAHDFACISLRYFNAAGAHPAGDVGEWHTEESHLIPLILKVLTGEREQITLFGTDYDTPDGTAVRDYIHVADLCKAHLLALNALEKGIKRDAFNLGTGTGNSVVEVVQMVEAVTGSKIQTATGSRRAGDPARLVASFAKAADVLGWKPDYSLRDIVETAWQWEQRMREQSKKSSLR